MGECGDMARDVVVKSDQEPAIRILVKDVVEERGTSGEGARTIVEES